MSGDLTELCLYMSIFLGDFLVLFPFPSNWPDLRTNFHMSVCNFFHLTFFYLSQSVTSNLETISKFLANIYQSFHSFSSPFGNTLLSVIEYFLVLSFLSSRIMGHTNCPFKKEKKILHCPRFESSFGIMILIAQK